MLHSARTDDSRDASYVQQMTTELPLKIIRKQVSKEITNKVSYGPEMTIKMLNMVMRQQMKCSFRSGDDSWDATWCQETTAKTVSFIWRWELRGSIWSGADNWKFSYCQKMTTGVMHIVEMTTEMFHLVPRWYLRFCSIQLDTSLLSRVTSNKIHMQWGMVFWTFIHTFALPNCECVPGKTRK